MAFSSTCVFLCLAWNNWNNNDENNDTMTQNQELLLSLSVFFCKYFIRIATHQTSFLFPSMSYFHLLSTRTLSLALSVHRGLSLGGQHFPDRQSTVGIVVRTLYDPPPCLFHYSNAIDMSHLKSTQLRGVYCQSFTCLLIGRYGSCSTVFGFIFVIFLLSLSKKEI